MTTELNFINTQEVAKILDCSTRTVLRMRNRGQLPFYKVGGRILFDRDEIIEKIKNTRVVVSKTEAEAA